MNIPIKTSIPIRIFIEVDLDISMAVDRFFCDLQCKDEPHNGKDASMFLLFINS